MDLMGNVHLHYNQPLSVSLFWSVSDFCGYCYQLFSQRGYQIIEILCLEILEGTLVYGGFSGGPICWGDLHRKDNGGT